MSYALVQNDALAPTLEQLKRAFKTVLTLTDADAVKVANEACGILLKNLSRDRATTLKTALHGEGVPTEVVEATQLPKLPDPKFVRRMEFQLHALLFYDPLGRAVPVEWKHVALVSAGAVRHFGMSTTKSEEMVHGFSPVRGFHRKLVTDVRHRIHDDAKLVLDIFLGGRGARFQIEADSFLFKYCFDRAELTVAQKVGLLIQMIAERAPHAALNRGASALRDNLVDDANYASKAALSDESTWLLWRMARTA